MGQIVTKSAGSTRLRVLVPQMHSLQQGAVARLGFCGACPTETQTSRREAGFPRVCCAYKPICMDCTLLHNGGRSTVWYAYPKERRAVILCDPLLFNLPRRGRSDSASAGRVPAEAHFTTDKGVDGRSRTFFFPCSQNVVHMPLKMIAAKIQLRNVSIFGPLVVVLVKKHRFKRFFNQSPPNRG